MHKHTQNGILNRILSNITISIDLVTEIRVLSFPADKINPDLELQSYLFVFFLILDDSFWKKSPFTKEIIAKQMASLETKFTPLNIAASAKMLRKLDIILLDMPHYEERTIQLEALLSQYLSDLENYLKLI
jgi:hypothetical protein